MSTLPTPSEKLQIFNFYFFIFLFFNFKERSLGNLFYVKDCGFGLWWRHGELVK
jgi:hypothetical protein